MAAHSQAAQSESGVEDLEESIGKDAIESQMRIRTLELELKSERDKHERHVVEVRNECEDLRKERDRLKGKVKKSSELVRVWESCEREKKELSLTAELKAVEEAEKEFCAK